MNRRFLVRIALGDENPQLSLPFEDKNGYLIHYPGEDSEDVYSHLKKTLGKSYNISVFPTIEREIDVNRQ